MTCILFDSSLHLFGTSDHFAVEQVSFLRCHSNPVVLGLARGAAQAPAPEPWVAALGVAVLYEVIADDALEPGDFESEALFAQALLKQSLERQVCIKSLIGMQSFSHITAWDCFTCSLTDAEGLGLCTHCKNEHAALGHEASVFGSILSPLTICKSGWETRNSRR
jgi:hypothetical protein